MGKYDVSKKTSQILRFNDLVCLDGKSFQKTYSPQNDWFQKHDEWKTGTHTWYPKQPFFNGCFSLMIPNLYIKNGFTISIH